MDLAKHVNAPRTWKFPSAILKVRPSDSVSFYEKIVDGSGKYKFFELHAVVNGGDYVLFTISASYLRFEVQGKNNYPQPDEVFKEGTLGSHRFSSIPEMIVMNEWMKEIFEFVS